MVNSDTCPRPTAHLLFLLLLLFRLFIQLLDSLLSCSLRLGSLLLRDTLGCAVSDGLPEPLHELVLYPICMPTTAILATNEAVCIHSSRWQGQY